MIIVIGHQKGGPGKSTLAENISYRLTSSNYRTMLFDTDDTGTSIKWAQRRSKMGLTPSINAVQNSETPVGTIIEMSQAYDAVVVDLGARDYAKMRELARVADLWIAPIQVGTNELESSIQMFDAFDAVKQFHKAGKIPLVFAFNRTPVSSSEEALARESLAVTRPELVVLTSALRDRKVYRDAQKLGRSIFEFPARDSAKAAAEFDALLQEAMAHAAT